MRVVVRDTSGRPSAPRAFSAAPVLLVLAVMVGGGCAARSPRIEAPRDGQPCRPGPVANYLAPAAQRCWYQAGAGRWRILDHEFHYDAIVFEVEASSLDAAEEVTRRLAERHGERFWDMTIYVQLESPEPASMVRRVLWNRKRGADQLDFIRNRVRPAARQS